MEKYDLLPKHDSAKSFYGKARVEIQNNGDKKLFSYNTLVAEMKDGKLKVYNTQSDTTVRHIREFALQNGLPYYSKKEFKEMEE